MHVSKSSLLAGWCRGRRLSGQKSLPEIVSTSAAAILGQVRDLGYGAQIVAM